MPYEEGSSPRWRGKQDSCCDRCASDRLIPALAGKTNLSVASDALIAAHPRAGGENNLTKVRVSAGRGSSPRWRGKPSPGRGFKVPLRLIPALAGKTFVFKGLSLDTQAHPRAGGENRRRPSLRRSRSGSSPRWRGKRIFRVGVVAGMGLIPALAGKTGISRAAIPGTPAHPRAGGENCLRDRDDHGRRGSSPRWRGKLIRLDHNTRIRRLIPALAGKTYRQRSAEGSTPAHPRAGGENV